MKAVEPLRLRDSDAGRLYDLGIEARRLYLADYLARHHGNRSAAARALGMQRAYLCRLAKELGLNDSSRPTAGRHPDTPHDLGRLPGPIDLVALLAEGMQLVYALGRSSPALTAWADKVSMATQPFDATTLKKLRRGR
jgi:hypothetical protein